VVGNLRLAVGRHPEDPLLAGLIGELTMKSPAFVSLSSDHRIAPCDAAFYDLRHPVVGSVTVTQQTLGLARSPGQNLIVVTTVAGSQSEEAIALLRQANGASGRPGAPAVGPRGAEAGHKADVMGGELVYERACGGSGKAKRSPRSACLTRGARV
jgi:hypothetical protein